MTSPDEDFNQTSNNPPSSNQLTNNYNRRLQNNNSHPYPTPAGIEVRLLVTFRDAGAVIGRLL